jgi:hypothetical protein
MRKRCRRFEVLLPHQFNDGRAVPKKWLIDAVFELAEEFGGAAHESQKVSGIWHHEKVIYREKFTRVVVDVDDKPENRQWMIRYKKRWKARLRQIELWMVSYRIEIE